MRDAFSATIFSRMRTSYSLSRKIFCLLDQKLTRQELIQRPRKGDFGKSIRQVSGRLFEKKVSRTAVGLKAFKRRPLTDPMAGFEFREIQVSGRFSPFRDKIFGIMRFFEAIQGFAPWRTYGRYPGQRGGRFSGKSIKKYRYSFIDKKISNCYVNRKFVW